MKIVDAIISGEMILRNKTYQQKHYETADDTVYICPNCGIAWEADFKNDRQKIYYSRGVVPTYGKKRKICPFCENKK